MARVLVLGATGHIGAHSVRALLSAGHHVRATYRSEQYRWLLDQLARGDDSGAVGAGDVSARLEQIHVDLETQDGLREALHGCDWVFHAAAFYPRVLGVAGGPGAKRRLGELGAKRGPALNREQAIAYGVNTLRRNFELIAKARPERIVFTSSAATIRRGPGLYPAVKMAQEDEVLRWAKQGLPVVLINPSVCIGEYDAHAFSGRLVLVFAKRQLPCYLEHIFSVVYTGDVGRAHCLAATQGRIGERYLISARGIAVSAWAQLVAQKAGVPAVRWRIPYGVALAGAHASELWARCTRTQPRLPRTVVQAMRTSQAQYGDLARRELGLTYTPIDQAVARALAWFKANGQL